MDALGGRFPSSSPWGARGGDLTSKLGSGGSNLIENLPHYVGSSNGPDIETLPDFWPTDGGSPNSGLVLYSNNPGSEREAAPSTTSERPPSGDDGGSARGNDGLKDLPKPRKFGPGDLIIGGNLLTGRRGGDRDPFHDTVLAALGQMDPAILWQMYMNGNVIFLNKDLGEMRKPDKPSPLGKRDPDGTMTLAKEVIDKDGKTRRPSLGGKTGQAAVDEVKSTIGHELGHSVDANGGHVTPPPKK